MKNYKCIKGFSIPIYDADGFETDEWSEIKDSTIWHTSDDDEEYRFIGGEVRLESDDLGWIEITKKTLEEYFKVI